MRRLLLVLHAAFARFMCRQWYLYVHTYRQEIMKEYVGDLRIFSVSFRAAWTFKKINFKKLIKNKNTQAADTRRNTNNPVTVPWRILSFIKHILATHPAYALLGLCKKNSIQ